MRAMNSARELNLKHTLKLSLLHQRHELLGAFRQALPLLEQLRSHRVDVDAGVVVQLQLGSQVIEVVVDLRLLERRTQLIHLPDQLQVRLLRRSIVPRISGGGRDLQQPRHVQIHELPDPLACILALFLLKQLRRARKGECGISCF